MKRLFELLAVFSALVATTASGEEQKLCGASIPQAKVRDLAIAERQKRDDGFKPQQWEWQVVRENCVYRVSAVRLPRKVASHFTVLIDEKGKVVRYFGGM